MDPLLYVDINADIPTNYICCSRIIGSFHSNLLSINQLGIHPGTIADDHKESIHPSRVSAHLGN